MVHIADFVDFTLRLLCGGKGYRTPGLSGYVFLNPHILTKILRIWTSVGVDLSVGKVEAKWIEVAILKADISLSKHGERFCFIRFYSSDRFLEQGLGLGSITELERMKFRLREQRLRLTLH